MKFVALMIAGLALVACAPSPENDPTLQALRANPPQEIPPDIWPRVKAGSMKCKVYEDRGRPYMLCWRPLGGTPPQEVWVEYFLGSDPGKIRNSNGYVLKRIRI